MRLRSPAPRREDLPVATRLGTDPADLATVPCALAVHGLCKTYPRNERPAVDSLSLEVAEGEILALVGESGSGKTTFLRMIAGLERPDDGTIVISGHTHCGRGCYTPPERRGTPLVFQDYALFPHLTVAENIGFGLRRLRRRERDERVAELLRLIDLEELGARYPHELSGGQQQRVALARALALQPPLVLLDEPFSNLDRALKQRLREQVARLLRETGTTAILVVHDYEDAIAVGDRIAVLRDGQIVQIGTPAEIREAPIDEYVAGLVGE